MERKSVLSTVQDQFLSRNSADFQNWEKMTALLVSKMGDDSIRDNTQSIYGNLYHLTDQLEFARGYNLVNKLVKDQGYQPARVEVTGGANVLESVRRLGENPFEILREVKSEMPDARLGMLLRGRQGSFYAPVPVEVQEKLVDKFVKEGVTDFSVFDMLNDKSNYLPSMQHIVKTYVEQAKSGVAEDKRVRLEICQSYITEPLDDEGNVKKAKVWGNTSFAKGYVDAIKDIVAAIPEEDRKYLDEKAFCLKNKDYAGLLNTERLTSFVNRTNSVLKEAFDKGEIPFVPNIIIHSHGEKPEMMANAFAMEGIEYVDTGVGKLSGGNAHSNMVNVLKQFAQKAGIDFAHIEGTEIYKAIQAVERKIEPINTVMQPLASKGLPWDVVDNLRTAGGGIAALDNIIKTPLNNGMLKSANAKLVRGFVNENPQFKGREEELHEMLKEDFASLKAKVYEIIPEMWEQGGRFHTVTPGAKILSDAAVTAAFRAKTLEIGDDGQPKVVNAIDHIRNDNLDKLIPHLVPTYKNIMKGRFGENQGAESLQLANFHDAIMLHDFAKEAESVMGNPALAKLLSSVAPKTSALNAEEPSKSAFYQMVKDAPDAVESLRSAINADANLDASQKKALIKELTTGKVEESLDQYVARTDYEKNVGELLKFAKGSKTWSEEDIKILAYDPTAVSSIKDALAHEKGDKLPLTSIIQSREDVIISCTLKLVDPKLVVPEIAKGRKLSEGDKGAIENLRRLHNKPEKEMWRRIEHWMKDFPEHITSVITDNKGKIEQAIYDTRAAYRAETRKEFPELDLMMGVLKDRQPSTLVEANAVKGNGAAKVRGS